MSGKRKDYDREFRESVSSDMSVAREHLVRRLASSTV